jgi:hypothetical protein
VSVMRLGYGLKIILPLSNAVIFAPNLLHTGMAKEISTGEFTNSVLLLLFNGTTYTGIAQNASSPLTVLYFSLHTSSPGATGNQSTNEAAYLSYSRVACNRASGANGFTISANSVSPTSTIVFPASSGTGSETETYFGLGTAASGNGHLMYFGILSPSIVVTQGCVPELLPATVITES